MQTKAHKKAWKIRQLCRQVERRLSLVFGELSDPFLSDLTLEAVEPEPGGGGLVVFLVLPCGVDKGEVGRETERRLNAVRGFLRAEVAKAIHRKRTPQLFFNVVAYEDAIQQVS